VISGVSEMTTKYILFFQSHAILVANAGAEVYDFRLQTLLFFNWVPARNDLEVRRTHEETDSDRRNHAFGL
jgi:hypothetical protein